MFNTQSGIMAVIVAVVLGFTIFIATINRKPASSESDDFRIVTIDGCEYIDNVVELSYHIYTHKGNCKNPIHIYKETK